MIKTQKQIHEQFLKAQAKMKGGVYLTEEEKLAVNPTREMMLDKLHKIKQVFTTTNETKIDTNHSFSITDNETSELLLKLRNLKAQIDRNNSFCNSHQYKGVILK